MTNMTDIKRDPKKALQAAHPQLSVICTPTNAGGQGPNELETFYTREFKPSPEDLGARLMSRTLGSDSVVDELSLKFKHDQEIPWLLPRVPPNDDFVDITVISIVKVKGGKVFQEKLYWDYASLLLQVDFLRRNSVPLV